jgi:hypothetical protein
MTRSKRLGAVLLTSSLLLGLAACGDDDDGDNSSDTTEATGGSGTTLTTGNGDGTDNDAARALRERMVDDGLTEEQADCTVEALGEDLKAEQMQELVEIRSGTDLSEDQSTLLAKSFQAAASCGYNIFNPDAN